MHTSCVIAPTEAELKLAYRSISWRKLAGKTREPASSRVSTINSKTKLSYWSLKKTNRESRQRRTRL